MAYLNLGSLILGLVAWILPVVNLAKRNKIEHIKWYISIFLSLSTCAIALLLQILYNAYLVVIEDWSALMDISRAVVIASSVLILVTLTLNIITLVKYKTFSQDKSFSKSIS